MRRSMRRIANVLGESSQRLTDSNVEAQPPPPDYNAVLVEMNSQESNLNIGTNCISGSNSTSGTIISGSVNNGFVNNGSVISGTNVISGNNMFAGTNVISGSNAISGTNGTNISNGSNSMSTISGTTSNHNTFRRQLANLASSSSGLTAADVASILRASFRRSTVRPRATTDGNARGNGNARDNGNARGNGHVSSNGNGNVYDHHGVSLSVENLMESAAPIGETSLVLEHLSSCDCEDLKIPKEPASVI